MSVKAKTRDVIVSVMALLMLLALLFTVDQRVHERFTNVAPNAVSVAVARSAEQLADAGEMVGDAVTEHTMLTIFVVAGTLLVTFMLRT